MKKLMKSLTDYYTTTGRPIKYFILLFTSFFLLGCPKEEPFTYNMQIINESLSALQITTKSDGEIDFEEDFSFETFIIRPNSTYKDGLFELETENPIVEFLEGWGGNNRFRIYKNNILLVDWRGPAYHGRNENHFYNINAWEIDDTPKSSNTIYTLKFTIYPEDLVQDAIE